VVSSDECAKEGVVVKLEGQARRLTVFLGEEDRYGHKSLATEIVLRAQQAGLAGATVVRGVEGFGASNHLHTARILSISNDLPIVVVIVDEAERIDEFMPQLDELITEGLVIVDDVEVIKYVGRSAP
jgi:PII-like signaling protein